MRGTLLLVSKILSPLPAQINHTAQPFHGLLEELQYTTDVLTDKKKRCRKKDGTNLKPTYTNDEVCRQKATLHKYLVRIFSYTICYVYGYYFLCRS